MKLYICTFLVGLMTLAYGQSNQLDKDLEITCNLLEATMSKSRQAILAEGYNWHFGGDNQVTATFNPEYGVIYELVSNHFTIAPDIGVRIENDSKEGAEEKKEKMLVIEQKIHGEIARVKGELGEDYQDVTDAIKDFIADYSDMVRELEENHKVMVKLANNRGSEYRVFFGEGQPNEQLVFVEAQFSDILDYRHNDITREELLEKIKVTRKTINQANSPDYRILANVLSDLFSANESKSYYMNKVPYFERIDDLGIKYYAKVYSSWRQGEDRYDMPTVNLKGISNEERNKEVENLYPVFVSDFKRAILDYGSILRDLKENEPLSFEINLTKCECEIPKTIQITTMKSLLDEYRMEEIDFEEAEELINVKVIQE